MPKATKVGVVKSNKMDKTAVVSVERLVRHPLYTRAFKKTSNFTVHDEENKLSDRRSGEDRRVPARSPRCKRWRLDRNHRTRLRPARRESSPPREPDELAN